MKRARFLDKTLLSVAHAAEQALFSEAYARKRGVLQGIDVRIKLVSFLCIIILISFLHSPAALWAAYGTGLLLAACSGISLRFFLKRVWFFVPLFSAVIVLPALLNIITPGEPVLVLARLPHTYEWGPYSVPAEIAVTRQGLWGGIVFVSRVAASVSFAVLLTLTTKWADIFSGLRSLFVPRVFVVALSMTERYLFVLLRLVQDMYRGRLSRTIKPLAPAVERNWTASRIGVTFKKSMDMSEAVYFAMLSRGFHGEFKTLNRFRVKQIDYVWLLMVIVAGFLLVLLDRGGTW